MDTTTCGAPASVAFMQPALCDLQPHAATTNHSAPIEVSTNRIKTVGRITWNEREVLPVWKVKP